VVEYLVGGFGPDKWFAAAFQPSINRHLAAMRTRTELKVYAGWLAR
jgi:hypothetical protein